MRSRRGNEVCLAQDIELFLRDIADDTDGKAGAGKRLTHYQILGQAKLAAERADLILEQQAQRFDDLLEVNEIGQASDIVVALDNGCNICAGLDNVGVDSALSEIVNRAYFLPSSSNTRINSSPMILRFASGSETPASFDRKRSCALTRMKFISQFLNAASTSSPSSLRMRP